MRADRNREGPDDDNRVGLSTSSHSSAWAGDRDGSRAYNERPTAKSVGITGKATRVPLSTHAGHPLN
jgi:hypothetical protein